MRSKVQEAAIWRHKLIAFATTPVGQVGSKKMALEHVMLLVLLYECDATPRTFDAGDMKEMVGLGKKEAAEALEDLVEAGLVKTNEERSDFGLTETGFALVESH